MQGMPTWSTVFIWSRTLAESIPNQSIEDGVNHLKQVFRALQAI